MKKLLTNFKKFLTEAQIGDYALNGELTLYHYAPVNQEEIVVDPKYFADKAKRSSFTMREYETSTVPRTFWYVDLEQKEMQVSSGRNLYQATILANRIYNFRNDPDGYKEMHRHRVYGLRKGMEWNTMLEHLRESYDGIFYSLSGFDVVSLFIPYDAARVSKDDQPQKAGE